MTHPEDRVCMFGLVVNAQKSAGDKLIFDFKPYCWYEMEIHHIGVVAMECLRQARAMLSKEDYRQFVHFILESTPIESEG